jgi:hypothetical protein
MNDIIFIGFALIAFGLGMTLVTKFKKLKPELYVVKKPECPPHAWKEFETAPGSGFVYLRCIDCNKTLSDIFGES